MSEDQPLNVSPDAWIIIPNWNKFQHYKDRDPTWIKVYTKLLHDPKFLELSGASRGLLVTIWLLYASESGLVRVRNLQRLGRHLAGYYQLEALNDAGFVDFSASKPLAPNKEEEKEKETPSPLTVIKRIPNKRAKLHDELLAEAKRAAEENTDSSDRFQERLDELERKHHVRLGEIERTELVNQATLR